MKKNWFYITIIFGLTVAAVYYWESPQQTRAPGQQNTEETDLPPYAVIANAQTSHFDEKGELSYLFIAKTLRHFRLNLEQISQGDYTSLDAPQLTIYTEDGPWFVTAEFGRLTKNGEILKLWNNVRIWQSHQDEQQITELKTDQLTIEPLKKIVKTSSKVEITSAQGRLESLGMHLNLPNKRIKLLKQVRGYHEPI